MKAITYSRYGPPETLTVKEVEHPSPKNDEVLIRVHAAEATKSDCEMRAFKFSVQWFWLPLRLAVGVTSPRRQILGGYFAGEIAATGADVTEFSVGDEVFGATGLRMGAYGQYLALPASATIALKPSNMSFVEAAAVPLGGLNALHFMRLAKIQPGERVLINGAGGVIGAHAVQIAKHLGAEVTAVDNGFKKELLHRLGAAHFIDYTKSRFTDRRAYYDVLFDMVPGTSFGAAVRTLKPKGRYLSGNPRLSFILRSMIANRFTNVNARFTFARETQEELLTLKAMIEKGEITPIVDTVFPMEQAPDAHRLVETEQRRGAIVLQLAD